jgi:trehalose/maltose hydrolase-like predicted phosphorylase
MAPPVGDPTWVIVVEGDGLCERVQEALLTVADGSFGTRGSREEDGDDTRPMVLTAGLFERRGEVEELLEGPSWTGLVVPRTENDDRRVLDLRRGLVWRELPTEGGAVCTVRFSSLARPGVMGLRATGPADRLRAGPPLEPPHGATARTDADADGERASVVVASSLGGGVHAAARQHESVADGQMRVERLVAYVADRTALPEETAARAHLDAASMVGFERLSAEHAEAWERRWAAADIVIDGGGDELQRAVRFSLFHLMASVGDDDATAVGARGLTGPSYSGHVFWDADVYVLPFLAATSPAAARSMLAYRLARLEAARQEATARGLRGARFPWESASSGREVTPRLVRHDDGTVEPIRTGDLEEHIVADVAWSAAEYAAWTGDEAFLTGDARPLVTETARFWASRARWDTRAHLLGVIGPDEYHEVVDDDAYTNLMARWNLRRAAALERQLDGDRDEAAAWEALADALVDGYDRVTGLFEQCAGFFDLEPLIISEIADPPVAADLLLGRVRVGQSQIIKQPDVLMAHHLIPTELPAGSLAPNLDFYLPRTAHGSSLSPAICASLLARAGRPDDAVDLFELACRLDLDDLTSTTAGGLHLATMGGVWQALVYGFAGVRPEPGVLRIDPHLPTRWNTLEINLSHRNQRLRLTIGHDTITVRAPAPVWVTVAGTGTHGLSAGETHFDRRADTWERRSR